MQRCDEHEGFHSITRDESARVGEDGRGGVCRRNVPCVCRPLEPIGRNQEADSLQRCQERNNSYKGRKQVGEGQCESGQVEKDYQATDNQEHFEGGRLEKGESRLHGIQQQEKRPIFENKHGGHRSGG